MGISSGGRLPQPPSPRVGQSLDSFTFSLATSLRLELSPPISLGKDQLTLGEAASASVNLGLKRTFVANPPPSSVGVPSTSRRLVTSKAGEHYSLSRHMNAAGSEVCC